ncbi:photosystem II core complex proteins psbY, chloroplastic-like [Lolium rigidum]|uniref:photosystem II core complex proteins psbY, chloroplastic-like n=1 Tax=Lolium rigidum TaxID=89674 RepID=UPI001F5D888F|nr:photosystem II core complex proteins psbY, chloroplastic-like [Lolium rigidum]
MATIATMAMLKPAAKMQAPSSSAARASPTGISLRTLQKGAAKKGALAVSPAAAAMAGAFFSSLATSEPAMAAQRIADVAAASPTDDNRGLLLLFVVSPALGWVLFNILQPALNQLNKMRSEKALVAGLGIGAAAAAGLAAAPEPASAAVQELAALAAATPTDDNRGLLLLFVVAPAIGWVLFNILQPALNQLNKMRSN